MAHSYINVYLICPMISEYQLQQLEVGHSFIKSDEGMDQRRNCMMLTLEVEKPRGSLGHEDGCDTRQWPRNI